MKLELTLDPPLDGWGTTIDEMIRQEVLDAIRKEVRGAIKDALAGKRKALLREAEKALEPLTGAQMRKVLFQLGVEK